MNFSVQESQQIVILAAVTAIAFGAYKSWWVLSIKVVEQNSSMALKDDQNAQKEKRMQELSTLIEEGAQTFLKEEYTYLAVFMVIFSIFIAVAVEKNIGELWTVSAFLVGGITSIISGFIGMKIAVKANVRTTK